MIDAQKGLKRKYAENDGRAYEQLLSSITHGRPEVESVAIRAYAYYNNALPALVFSRVTSSMSGLLIYFVYCLLSRFLIKFFVRA